MRAPGNVAVRWKKWPLLGLVIFLMGLIIMLTASLNDQEKPQRHEKNDKLEINPYATEPTKIIMPEDETKISETKNQNEPDTGNQNEPDIPKRNKVNTELPEGYIRWKEPQSKLSDPNGPGQGGKSVPISADENQKIQEAYNEYGFNQYVSDKISLHRSVPDIRPIRLDITSLHDFCNHIFNQNRPHFSLFTLCI